MRWNTGRTAPLEFLQQHALALHALLPAAAKNARITPRWTEDSRCCSATRPASRSAGPWCAPGATLTASEATRSLCRSVAELDIVLGVAEANWFLDLLATPHSGAATEITRALSDEAQLSDAVLASVASSGGAILVRQRLEQAVSVGRSTDIPGHSGRPAGADEPGGAPPSGRESPRSRCGHGPCPANLREGRRPAGPDRAERTRHGFRLLGHGGQPARPAQPFGHRRGGIGPPRAARLGTLAQIGNRVDAT